MVGDVLRLNPELQRVAFETMNEGQRDVLLDCNVVEDQAGSRDRIPAYIAASRSDDPVHGRGCDRLERRDVTRAGLRATLHCGQVVDHPWSVFGRDAIAGRRLDIGAVLAKRVDGSRGAAQTRTIVELSVKIGVKGADAGAACLSGLELRDSGD